VAGADGSRTKVESSHVHLTADGQSQSVARIVTTGGVPAVVELTNNTEHVGILAAGTLTGEIII
jgi:urease accessory protein UreE